MAAPKKPKKTRGRNPPALTPPATPTSMSASAHNGRRRAEKGKGKERADQEFCPSPSQAKRRKTRHEDMVQDTRSYAEPGPSTRPSTSISHMRSDPLFLDSDSSRSPSPLNILRTSSPAPLPPSSAFPTPSTSRSVKVNVSRSIPSSPCPAKRPIPDDDVISISSDSEDEPIADPGPSLSGDDWLRNIAPFNGTPSVYSQRKARESQQSFRKVPASIHDSDAHPEDDDAMDLDLESVRGSQSQSVTPACHQPFSSSASINIAPRPYCSAPLRSSFIGNNALADNADGDASGDFLRDATVVRSLE